MTTPAHRDGPADPSWPADLVVATHNPGKRHEWRALLGPVPSAADLGVPAVDETATTFIGNALLKARSVVDATGRPSLGEDSGLELKPLDGHPGVRTARFMREVGGWPQGMRRLMEHHTDPGATYVCAVALVWPGGTVVTAEARVHGRIEGPRGEGPGVAPWFVPDGHTQTWAELGAEWRLLNDHRARAIAALRPQFWARIQAAPPRV